MAVSPQLRSWPTSRSIWRPGPTTVSTSDSGTRIAHAIFSNNVAGSHVFSTLVLVKGVLLGQDVPRQHPITAIITPFRLLEFDEYGDRVALRKSVMELASKLKKAPDNSSTALKMARETKSFPAPADHLLISIGGDMTTGGWSEDILPIFCDTVQNFQP